MKILVSAGEASGDRYAAQLVAELRERLPGAEFFGCAGGDLRQAGVRPVIRAEDLAVVGIFEVASHIPRIYQQFRRLAQAAEQQRPDLAILTDSPDFHLRLAQRLHRAGIPIFYYVAPQVWAWRKSRLRLLQRFVDHLLCIFPFEEQFFRDNGVASTYVGHPLAGSVFTTRSREDFLQRLNLNPTRPVIVLLPGSRKGEAARHLPALLDAVNRLLAWKPVQFVLHASSTTGKAFFAERIGNSPVQIIEEGLHDAVGHADLALVASGTATIEAALLVTPMVTFYRVTAPSWLVGKLLVKVPFYSMVNLLAGRRIVPELMQSDFTGERLAHEARRILDDEEAYRRMKRNLETVRGILNTSTPAAQRAAEVICEKLEWKDTSTRQRNSIPVS